ncbi:MAG: hypothetical protein ACT4N4_17800 [Rhodospirillales bacterium]
MTGGPGADDARTAIGAELALPALAVAFAAYFFHSVWDLSWEAKANAVMIGVALLALIAVFLVRLAVRTWNGLGTFSFAPLIAPRRVLGQRVLLVVLSGLFIVLIPWLGLTLGLFLLTATLMVVMRAGSWRLIAATAGIVAASAYLLFIALLNSRLPRGPVEKLLAGLF